MAETNCYGCKHRRPLPGNTHSSCAHPLANQEMFHVLLGSGYTVMGLSYNRHGVEMGWFTFPFDFDPAWLYSCNQFEAKEKV